MIPKLMWGTPVLWLYLWNNTISMPNCLLNPTTAVRNQYLFFSKLHVLGIQGTKISFAQCADACRSKGYHYFGRIEEERCRCGGVTCSDLLFQTHGRMDYNWQHCKCDSTNIGTGYIACVYRLVDQWDPDTARQQHKWYHLPMMDMRKICYISCHDVDESLTNMFMCKILQTTSLQHLSRKIAKWYDANGGQLHLLGGDVPGAGTFWILTGQCTWIIHTSIVFMLVLLWKRFLSGIWQWYEAYGRKFRLLYYLWVKSSLRKLITPKNKFE